MSESDPAGTPPPPRPVWVKVFSLVVAALGIVFIAVHLLTGGGAQMMNH